MAATKGVSMNQRISRRFFALCIVFGLAVFAHAQDYKPLLGDWNMTSESDGDPIKWTLSLKEVEGKLAATCGTADGEKPAKNVTFADGVLKFDAPYEDNFYGVTLKPNGNKLEGMWEGDGSSGKTYGFKN
jgi:hypothetical protein